jgi:hypothetical protein
MADWKSAILQGRIVNRGKTEPRNTIRHRITSFQLAVTLEKRRGTAAVVVMNERTEVRGGVVNYAFITEFLLLFTNSSKHRLTKKSNCSLVD